MFERPEIGDRAVLVQPRLLRGDTADSGSEFRELSRSAGVAPEAVCYARAARPHPATFFGKGKVDEIRAILERHGLHLVLVNHVLSPAQERNLEAALKARVLDRTGLILDIFAQRAYTHEGKLQVELAQLRHLSTRLVRGWTHLERQKGGIGLRGPGETQLETDRRLLTRRIRHLRSRLGKVRQQRAQSRRGRQRSGAPVVALVGYTNAGKSTLFNALTGARVGTADRLFATLDPRLRQLDRPGPEVILADTVGFIRDLPHELVAAFRATLEETRYADLLLHVIDASAPDRDERMRDVDEVLEEIGAGEVPRIKAFNKTDLIRWPMGGAAPAGDRRGPVRVSAKTGSGLVRLEERMVEAVAGRRLHRRIHLPPAAGKMHARLHALGAVVSERAAEDGGWRMELDLAPSDAARIQPFVELEGSV